MHKILALAQNVGAFSKYRWMSKMQAANVGGKCRQQIQAANIGGKYKRQIQAANIGGKAVRNCKITAPHDIRQKQGGR